MIHLSENKTLTGVSGAVLCVAMLSMAGCDSRETVAAGEASQVVYLCSETKQIVRAPLQPTPTENPATGRKTLVRALYCSKCKTWHAIPPEMERSGNPLRYQCPKHKIDMSPDGPAD